jgi:hypothetical protein
MGRGRWIRTEIPLVMIATALLAAPASGEAATQFGSNLSPGYTVALGCNGSPCTVWNAALLAQNTAGTLTAPSNGVITSYSILTAFGDPGWAPIHLRVIRTADNGLSWSGLGASTPDVTPSGAGGLQTFGAQVPVGAGDYVGLETNAGNFLPGLSSIEGGLVFLQFGAVLPSKPPVPSSNLSDQGNTMLALRATLEPDADRDGFGDETQDRTRHGPKQPTACSPSRATMVGTTGPDSLVGTPTRDVILGLSGRDRIRGLAGPDVICGQDGADLLKGGGGPDLLVGGPGADRIVGGAGRDRCSITDPRCR